MLSVFVIAFNLRYVIYVMHNLFVQLHAETRELTKQRTKWEEEVLRKQQQMGASSREAKVQKSI